MNRPEQALQIAAINYLRLALPDCQVMHYPAGGKRSKVEAKIFKAMGVLAGAPDILIVWGDTWIGTWDPDCRQRRGSGWIELKAGKGKLSKAQEVFRDDCKRKGIFWAEARSLDDCERAVRSWGLKPRASVWCGILAVHIEGAVRDLRGRSLGEVAREHAADLARRYPYAGSDVRELPNAQVVPDGFTQVAASECCKHGVPLRWSCQECDNPSTKEDSR